MRHSRRTTSASAGPRWGLACTLAVALAGCAEMPGWQEPASPAVSRASLSLTPAQECAVGYDLARQVYEQVPVDGATIRVGREPSGCTRHAVTYLRLAGFAVSEEGRGSGEFRILLADAPDLGGFIATALLPGLTVSRAYSPGEGGVHALSPATVFRHAAGGGPAS